MSQTDYTLLHELCQFLKHFKKITELFSGDKYPTQNYAVLFRSELKALLEVEPQDSIEIKRLKENMAKNFDHRFPLSQLHIVSALLDPRFQNLFDVREYLKRNQISAVDLLIKWLETTNVSNIESTDRNSTADNMQTEPQSQSYIDELVERHSTLSSLSQSTSTSSQSEGQRECHLLLSMGGKLEIKDIMIFWKNHRRSMPKLAKLAS